MKRFFERLRRQLAPESTVERLLDQLAREGDANHRVVLLVNSDPRFSDSLVWTATLTQLGLEGKWADASYTAEGMGSTPAEAITKLLQKVER